jgi:hypothetical protein
MNCFKHFAVVWLSGHTFADAARREVCGLFAEECRSKSS